MLAESSGGCAGGVVVLSLLSLALPSNKAQDASAANENNEEDDDSTESLKSWSRRINDATERFEVLKKFKNEAVLDRETQLVWERAPQDPFLLGIFSVAVEHCYARIVDGRMGWRLPTVEELTSLLVETPTTNPGIRLSVFVQVIDQGVRIGLSPQAAPLSGRAGLQWR
jgi:hypothetical protein